MTLHDLHHNDFDPPTKKRTSSLEVQLWLRLGFKKTSFHKQNGNSSLGKIYPFFERGFFIRKNSFYPLWEWEWLWFRSIHFLCPASPWILVLLLEATLFAFGDSEHWDKHSGWRSCVNTKCGPQQESIDLNLTIIILFFFLKVNFLESCILS